MFYLYLDTTQGSELDQLMERLGGETAKEEVEDCDERKSRRRRRLLNNLLDFLALVFSKLVLKIQTNFQHDLFLFSSLHHIRHDLYFD